MNSQKRMPGVRPRHRCMETRWLIRSDCAVAIRNLAKATLAKRPSLSQRLGIFKGQLIDFSRSLLSSEPWRKVSFRQKCPLLLSVYTRSRAKYGRNAGVCKSLTLHKLRDFGKQTATKRPPSDHQTDAYQNGHFAYRYETGGFGE